MSDTPKPLSTDFTGRGDVKNFRFQQIKKTDKGFIYKVTQPEGTSYFEVFKYRVNNYFNTVTYPSSKQFGKTAWTCSTLKDAEEYLKSF